MERRLEPNQMTCTTKDRALDLAILSLFLLGAIYIFIATPFSLTPLLSSPTKSQRNCSSSTMFKMTTTYRDELEEVLAEASTENNTVIIAMVNKAYVEGDKSMLDLFLDGFWVGDGTQGLINHILIVAIDQVAYLRCKFLRLHCYRLGIDGSDFAEEKTFMSEDYVKMMWRRTQFLGDVLKRGYNFIFTDTDVLWLRNPFSIPGLNETIDFQISTDHFNGSDPNHLNNGISIVRSNNRTISMFDYWYEKRKDYVGLNEQEV